MNRIASWTRTVAHRLDRLLGQVANHEALAEAVLDDVRQTAARARAHLAGVRRDAVRLSGQVARQHECDRGWRERARRLAGTDPERALECLRRSRRAARDAVELERRVGRVREVEARLASDIGRIEEHLAALASRRELIRARQGRTADSGAAGELELEAVAASSEVFERWEVQLAELESTPEIESRGAEPDPALEEAELRRELRELVVGETETEEETS